MLTRRLADILPADCGGLLVVSLGDFGAQGVICRRQAGGRVTVERYAAVDFESSVRRVKTRLKKLLEAFGDVAVRDVLIVSGEVSLIPSELPVLPAGRRGSGARQRLHEAARWEVAPFLDYPAEEALTGVLYLPAAEEDEELDFEPEEARRPVLISCVRGAIYEKMAELCRCFKLRLVGMLPAEVFAFACADPEFRRFAILDWQVHDVVCAMMHDGAPARITRLPVENDPGETVAGIMQELAEDSPEEIIVGGPEYKTVPDGTSGLEIRPWTADLAGVECPGPVPAAYMTAVSAASGNPGAKALTVNNRPGLVQWFKANVYALPVAIMLLLLLGMGGEYLHLRYRTAAIETRIEVLEEQKKELADAAAREAALKKRYSGLNEKKRALNRDIDLIQKRLPRRNARQLTFMEGLVPLTPAGIQLTSVEQFSDRAYHVRGRAVSFSMINQYVVNLKNLEGVQDCRMENSRTAPTGKKPGALQDFTMRVRLTED